jgi:hypothetical protein
MTHHSTVTLLWNPNMSQYVDESWVDSSLTFRKFWQSDDVMGIQTSVNSGNRLIMLHVGGINGFLPNSQLV